MWETCAQRVQDFGSKVHLRHRVEHVEVRDHRVVALHVQTADGSKRIEGEHFFSTMPIRTLVHAITPAAPEHVRAAAAGLRYRDFLVVALIIDAADLFPDNWIYIHSRGVQVGRIQNFNNWSRAMVPDEGRTCIGMEYFCFEGDGLWDSKDEDLIALAKTELAELKLGDADLVVDGTVVRMPKAYPIYDAEYRGHLDKVQDYLDGISNLHPVGRNGMHKYNNQDHSMLTAMMSVWNMMGAQHDVWAVNTDFEYHEEMRLSDPPSVAGSRASTATSA